MNQKKIFSFIFKNILSKTHFTNNLPSLLSKTSSVLNTFSPFLAILAYKQYVSRHFHSNHQFIYLQRTARVISVTKSSLNERNILKIKFTVKDPFKVLNLMSFCLHQNVIKYRYKYKYNYFVWIITFNVIELIDIYIFSIEIVF